MKSFIYLLLGLLFGLGLAYSGMTDPAKVLGFLDLLGDWDPTLIFVMTSGVTTTMLAYFFILKRRPLLADSFCLPTLRHIDRNLVVGAILFGTGWGLYGYCPGPAIAALSYLHTDTFLFVAAMCTGVFLQNLQKKRHNSNS
jgi:uncharacterized protein